MDEIIKLIGIAQKLGRFETALNEIGVDISDSVACDCDGRVIEVVMSLMKIDRLETDKTVRIIDSNDSPAVIYEKLLKLV